MIATERQLRNININRTLRECFGFRDFRPHQEKIVRAVLQQRDVFAVMPTGGGKSLCYQLPAHIMPGLGVVISPLISLMKDQVDAARANGIRAEYLNSSQTAAEQEETLRKAMGHGCDLLYIAPERLAMPEFAGMLLRCRLCLFAVDEAHCISDWGHDFRPDYLNLCKVLRRRPDVPLLAFTATATETVQADTIRKLGLHEPFTLRASFNRPNLFYRVLPKMNVEDQVLAQVRQHPGASGIVYCGTRRAVEETAHLLDRHGVASLPYHAGLENAVRKDNQERFISGETRVIAATIAFGMGIDKPDVRFVLHTDLPKNIEGYYQETGRAGRDGRTAHCTLFFGHADISRIRYFIGRMPNARQQRIARRKLAEMVHYGESHTCRRRALLAYFGEQYPHRQCSACDVCRPAKSPHRSVTTRVRGTWALNQRIMDW